MSNNNKRKFTKDKINPEQNKKIHIDENKNDITVEDICKRAKLFNNKTFISQRDFIIIYDDGKIVKFKDKTMFLLNCYHILYPPLDIEIRFKMPLEDVKRDCSYAFVTMIDALRLRVDMTKCANISDDYSSIHLKHKETVNNNTDPDDWLKEQNIMMDKYNKLLDKGLTLW
jgi:hypothetical protein